MKPRVLFLDHKASVGGSELSLLDIARDNLGTSRVILLADGPFRKRLEEAGVEVDVLPVPGAVSGISREGGLKQDLFASPHVLGTAWRVAKLSRRYELLYANSQKALIIGALAGVIARKPVIWHQRALLNSFARDTSTNYFSSGHRRLAALSSNFLIKRIIANSKATAEALIESGVRANRVRVVHNGIDSSPFEMVAVDDVDDLRRELGLEGAQIVGAFGRITPWKGHHVLLEALPRLPEVHALLVGEASAQDQDYAEALRKRSRDLGLEDRVHFLGFRRDIPQLMHLSDIVVHTSVAPEPFGRVIVEGMLARCPVVATRGGGVPEIIDDGINGILVPPGDEEALAEALRNLLADSAGTRALAEAGHVTALERFSLRAMLEGVAKQLEEVVGQR